jgi:hypothetical protein
MTSIEEFCSPQFDDRRIINDRLIIGSRQHVAFMVADNPGGLKDGWISVTNTKIGNLVACMSADETDTSTKEGLTMITDEDVVAMRKQMRRTYGSLVGYEGLPAVVMHAFFPHKLADVNGLSKTNYEATMDRMILNSGTYSTYVPVGTAAAYSALKGTADTDTDLHTGSKAVIRTDSTAEDAASKILRDQLTDNECNLSVMYRLVLGKAATFFMQSTFFPENHYIHVHSNGLLAPQTRVVAYHGTPEEGTEIYVKSKSLGKISGWILVNAADPFTETFTVDAERSRTFHAELIGGATGTYLVLINDNLVGGLDVEWEVDVIN